MVFHRSFSVGDEVICVNNTKTPKYEVGDNFVIMDTLILHTKNLYYILPYKYKELKLSGLINLNKADLEYLVVLNERDMLSHFTPIGQLTTKDIFRLKIAGRL